MNYYDHMVDRHMLSSTQTVQSCFVFAFTEGKEPFKSSFVKTIEPMWFGLAN